MKLPERLEILLMEFTNYHWLRELLCRGQVYLVGGCVRDAYRNEPLKDIDLIVENMTLAEIKEILISYGRVDVVGESFLVIKFKPTGYEGEPFDIAVPRTDRKTGEGHKDFEVKTEGVSILQDLERRDFTINSVAIKVISMEVLDPYDGIQDIELRIIRATNPKAFIDDPLRIIRGIQFAARFDYRIERETLKLMKENSHLIKNITGERIMEELMKIVKKDGNTQIALNLLHETDVDQALFDKKMLHYSEGFEYLDAVSFFYVLGLFGDVDPGDFIRTRLKGEYRLEKDVRNLDRLFTEFPKIQEEEDLKFMLSKLFSESPSIMDAVIIPDEVDAIVLQMRLMKIPKSLKSLLIDGNDVMTISQNRLKGKEIGNVLDKVLRDALMNRFDWKDKRESMEHLAQIIYES